MTPAAGPGNATDLDVATRLRRGVAAFTLGCRQFWQGYWQSPTAC